MDYMSCFNLMYDAFFYFLPVFLGYVEARYQLQSIYGIYLGTLIIVPGFINLVGVQNSLMYWVCLSL